MMMSSHSGQRGVALPVALIALTLLTTLFVAFAVLSSSEPTIATNHALAAQARALAEAGIERAVWALSNATAIGGIPEAMADPIAAAPYDGSRLITLGEAGGFFLTVIPGRASNERVVDAVGWAPTNASSDLRPKSHRRVQVILTRVRWLDPPAALTVRGVATITGSALIDARSDPTCGAKAGIFTTDDTKPTGAAAVYGHGDGIPNQTTGSPADIMANQPTSVLDQHLFSDGDLDQLRALAKCCGTYIGPGSPSTWSSRASITFDAVHTLPKDGVIFIDSRTGKNVTSSTPEADIADVYVTGEAAPAGQTEWRGWLVVNGRLHWQGNVRARGLVYAQADLSWLGAETMRGVIVSRNVRDTPPITVNISGNSTIVYDCAAARSGGGTIPRGWFVRAGTYRELPD